MRRMKMDLNIFYCQVISYNQNSSHMLHNIGPVVSKIKISPQKPPTPKDALANCSRLPAHTEPEEEFKSSIHLNPQSKTLINYEPTLFEKLCMFPLPFLMVGCCISQTTILEFDHEAGNLVLTIYPGLLSCFQKEYRIPFIDIYSSKIFVAFNRRINKRQAYRLYLETRIGEFELTTPKNREEIMQQKSKLDEVLNLLGIGKQREIKTFP